MESMIKTGHYGSQRGQVEEDRGEETYKWRMRDSESQIDGTISMFKEIVSQRGFKTVA